MRRELLILIAELLSLVVYSGSELGMCRNSDSEFRLFLHSDEGGHYGIPTNNPSFGANLSPDLLTPGVTHPGRRAAYTGSSWTIASRPRR